MEDRTGGKSLRSSILYSRSSLSSVPGLGLLKQREVEVAFRVAEQGLDVGDLAVVMEDIDDRHRHHTREWERSAERHRHLVRERRRIDSAEESVVLYRSVDNELLGF